MATKDLAYDHAAYISRFQITPGEIGPGATTQYAKFAAFAALQLFSAQLSVTTAGTATGHLVSIIRISGTATSTLAKIGRAHV